MCIGRFNNDTRRSGRSPIPFRSQLFNASKHKKVTWFLSDKLQPPLTCTCRRMVKTRWKVSSLSLNMSWRIARAKTEKIRGRLQWFSPRRWALFLKRATSEQREVLNVDCLHSRSYCITHKSQVLTQRARHWNTGNVVGYLARHSALLDITTNMQKATAEKSCTMGNSPLAQTCKHTTTVYSLHNQIAQVAVDKWCLLVVVENRQPRQPVRNDFIDVDGAIGEMATNLADRRNGVLPC